MAQPTQPLPRDVVAGLERGDKIEAIKRLREATGLVLAEAKAVVEQHPRMGTTAGVAADEVLQQVVAALQAGRLLEAIKLLRAHSGLGLKEAKNRVDALRRQVQASASPQGLAPGEVPRKGWLGRLLFAVLLAAVLAWLFLRG